MPPSISTTASGSASRTSTSASRAATAPSTWRPPWFDTITPSMPCVERAPRVVGREHALDEQRQLRPRAQPVEVVPGEPDVREGREHRRGCGEQILRRRLVELRQEHGIVEELPAPLALDERQVRVAQVARPPAEGECVERDDDGAVARPSARETKLAQMLTIGDPVELEPARTTRLGDLLRADASRRSTRSSARPREAAARATPTSPSSEAIDSTPSGAKKNGAGDGVPRTSTEMSRFALPVKHARPDAPASNAREVRAHGRFAAGAARDVAERAGVELLLGGALPVLRADGPLGRLLRDVDRVLDARSGEAHTPILLRDGPGSSGRFSACARRSHTSVTRSRASNPVFIPRRCPRGPRLVPVTSHGHSGHVVRSRVVRVAPGSRPHL